MKVKREIKLGILFIATLLLFIWGINYLKGRDIFSRQISFYVVYEEVDGLLETNPVTISGVKVGQVSRISFYPDGSGRVLVRAVASREIGIPVNSVARLTSPDIIGEKEIQIELGDADQRIQDGDTLAGIVMPGLTAELDRYLRPITIQAESLLAQMDTVFASVAVLFDEHARENLRNSLTNIRDASESISHVARIAGETAERESENLSELLASALSIANNIEAHNETFDHIIGNFSDISDAIAARELENIIANTASAMEQMATITEKIGRGEGSAGLLMEDEELYRKLEASSRQLELLLQDIRENPGRYFRISVFGR